MKRVAIYLRVSTDKQSTHNQRRELEAVAKRSGWHLVRVSEHQEARAAALQAVRARVTADYLSDLREQRNLLAFRRIAGKYRIVTSEPRA